MMNKNKPCKCHVKTKLRYMILVYLTCNRGRKYTAKEIWQFIIDNKLVNTRDLPQYTILKGLHHADIQTSTGILRNVVKVKEGRYTKYYIP